ncbi:MAG: GNAT family N-acetyltransferase [candidate division Zixibacteria bacterium]|nr:GNAT family N-acetyltransferase [candidate division Zixibacteria bacterium]
MSIALQNKARIIRPGRNLREKALQLSLIDPLGNAALIADLTQLYADCSILLKIYDNNPVSLIGYYRDLPFHSISLIADSLTDIHELFEEMLNIHPELGDDNIFGLFTNRLACLIGESFDDVEALSELQMVLSNNDIPDIPFDTTQYRLERLGASDLVQISHLYSLVPAMAWTPKTLTYGPCYGIYYGDMLVSIAGVHFSTKWAAEIGNIVTHPKHRRLNLAYACTKAVADDLRGTTENIFLCVMSDNTPAIRLYEKMGFVTHQELFLTRFRIK